MDAVTLQPAAGAQGELAGVLMIRAYHLDARASPRNKVLIPDSAHGTNPAPPRWPASRSVQIQSDETARWISLDLERQLDEDVAALHDHQPQHARPVRPRILEVDRDCATQGRAGLHRRRQPERHPRASRGPATSGFDIMHFNLHKTFSTPHGGGGPGRGPGRRQGAPGALPADARGGPATPTATRSTGPAAVHRRLQVFYGNFGMLVRAYTYIRTHGADGLRAVSENAVLNANYILARLEGALRPALRRAPACTSSCSRRRRQKTHGVTAHGHRQAAARPRLPPAHGLFPADRRGSDDDRADRDRVQGDARPVRRRDDPDRREAEPNPDTLPRRRSRRRCAGSTRLRPRGSRTSAGRRGNSLLHVPPPPP